MAISAVVVGLLAAVAVLVVHLPMVRARVLTFASRQLASLYDLDLNAARLDYNLFSRRVTLTDVRLAARGHEPDPFLTAARVEIVLPWSIVRGVLAFTRIDLAGASLSMLTFEDGSSNLPAAGGTRDPNLPPLRLDVRGLTIDGLDFAYVDRVRGLHIAAGDLHADLANRRIGDLPDVSGPIEIRKGVRLAFGDRAIVADPISGSLAFDGSNVFLKDVGLKTVEGALLVNGRVERVLDRPGLDLQFAGTADVARAADWGTVPVKLGGSTTLTGTIAGAAAEPTVEIETTSNALTVGRISGIAHTSQMTLTTNAVVIDKATVSAGGGSLDAAATIPFATTEPIKATASWRDFDVRTLLGLIDQPDRPIAASMTGTLQYERTDEGPLALRVANNSRASSGNGVGVTGELALQVANGLWQVRQQHAIPGALAVKGDLNGRVDGPAFSTATINAQLDTTIEDVARASQAVERLGLDLPAITESINGPAHAAVTLAGRVDAIETRSIVESPALKLPSLAPQIVHAEVETNAHAVRVSNVTAAVGGARLSGRADIDLRSRQLSGGFDLEAPDVAELLAEPPGGLSLHGPITANATLAGTTTEPQVTIDASGNGLDVNGQVIDSVVARARVTAAQIDVESFEAHQREGALSGSGRYAWGPGAYTADLNGSNLSWTGPLIGSTESTVRITTLRYAGSGTLDQPGGDADAAFEITGGVAGTLVGEGTANARVTGDTAAIIARVPALGAFVESKIATHAPYTYDANAVVNRLNLAALAPVAGAAEGTIQGDVSLSATASGVVTDVAESGVLVNLQNVDATVADVPIKMATPSRLAWQDSTLTVDALELGVGQGKLLASGALARTGATRWDATFNGELGDLVHMARPFGAPTELDSSGQIAARWQSTAGLDGSTGSVQLSGGTLAWGTMPPITALTLQAAFDNQTITVPALTGTWQEGGIQGSAAVPRAIVDGSASTGSVPPGKIDLHMTKLEASAFEPWLGRESTSRIKGQVSASLNADILGPRLEDIRGALTLDEAAFTLAAVDVRQTRPSRITFDHGIATMEDVAWTFGGSPLLLTGSAALAPADKRWLDLAFAGDMDLRVLAAFAPTMVTDGAATVDIWASGVPSEAHLTGRLELKDASLAIRDPRILIGQVNGPIVWERGAISVDGVTGVANGGDLSLHGRLTLDGTSIAGGQVVAQLQRVALEFPQDLQSEISGLITLTPDKSEWVLGGDVRIDRSAYTEPVSLAALITRRQPSRPPVVRQEGPSLAERLRLNVSVVTAEDLRIDNNYGRLEAGAAFRLVGTADRPGLTGRVDVREGGQFYLAGNTFYVEHGSVSFTSPNRIEPEIDVLARGVVSGTDLQLTLSGTPQNLKTDVHPTDPSASTDREARDALYGGLVGDEQALTLLSGELLGVTGRALGLDALRIERGFQTDEIVADPTLIATETDPTTRLTLSKRIRPEVELTLSQSLSESGALSAIISYKPRRNIEIRAASRDNIDRSLAVRHEITFGGAGTTRSTASLQPRVAAIHILGMPGRPESEIRHELRLGENDRFDFHRWQRGVDDVREVYLKEGYYEARVGATREVSPDESTVTLNYTIERGPQTKLVVEGHPLHAELVDELEDAWTRIIFDQFLLDEIQTRITRHLLAENLVGGTVEARVAVSTAEQKEVHVTIVPGAQVAKREIRYSGNQSVPSSRLDTTVEQAGLQIDGWLNPPMVTNIIEDYYREQGYLSARASAGESLVEGNVGVLPIVVEEGPRFVLSDARFSGVSEDRQPFLERAARILTKGDPYDRAAVDRMADQIERAYRRRGFNDVQVESRGDVDAAVGTIAITFDVQEGPQQMLREVSTEGATRTRNETIRRALRLEPGQPVNLEQWSQSRKRMYDTNVFRQVDIEPVTMEATPEEDAANIQPIRAVVRVSEYPVWRLRYGVQYRDEQADEEATAQTTQRGFGVLGDLQNRNLFGRAVTGGVAVSYQPWRQATSLFASNGSFFGLPIRSNAFLFNVRENDQPGEFFETITDRRGVSFEQRWRPIRSTEVTWGYRYEWTHVFEPNPLPDQDIFLDEIVRTGRIRSAVYVDRRNDPFNAQRGWFSSINFDKAAPFLGADFPYTKVLLQQFYYRALGPIVLASGARVGVAYRAENIDFDNRFFAGGGTTVRGYAEDALGPRDPSGNQPLGGGSLLLLNQEVRFPLFSRLSGVVFIDAGNVWMTRGELSASDLELGYGFGLRVNTPFALLRVDYGIPQASIPPGRRTGFGSGRWYFGIGQAF